LGVERGVGVWECKALLGSVEGMEEAEADAEFECCRDERPGLGAVPVFVLPRFEVELAAEMLVGLFEAKLAASSCPTHQSHSNQPINVAMLPQPTTATGDTRSWNIPTKQTTKMMTEQTC
jgi:hypothetical protein